jgi:hypothetical protein
LQYQTTPAEKAMQFRVSGKTSLVTSHSWIVRTDFERRSHRFAPPGE